MIVRSGATFTSDLPEDHIEDEEDIIQYGGKSVAEAIGEILTQLGCVVTLTYADFKGWELDVGYKNRNLWCRVSIIDSYLFFFEDCSLVRNILRRPHPSYLDILSQLADELGRDPRFHDVLWFRSEDMLSDVPGATAPVSAS
jgi:hypothetical protein